MEVTDAYQEYVERRREEAEIDPLVTLTLPQTEMASIGSVLVSVVEDSKKELEPATLRRWDRILSAIARAVQEAD